MLLLMRDFSDTETVIVKLKKYFGLSVAICNEKALVIRADSKYKSLSSAVLNGGLNESDCFFNLTVDIDYDEQNPRQDLIEWTQRLSLPENSVGLMTAVDIHDTQISFMEYNGLHVAVFATAGIGNAWSAGVKPVWQVYSPGTINIMVFTDANLSASAMLNAVMTTTEAKTRAMHEKNVMMIDGTAATGTNTDSCVFACKRFGEQVQYAGTATDIGYLIGAAVYESILLGIDRYREYCGL